jgi:hypothetical protein
MLRYNQSKNPQSLTANPDQAKGEERRGDKTTHLAAIQLRQSFLDLKPNSGLSQNKAKGKNLCRSPLSSRSPSLYSQEMQRCIQARQSNQIKKWIQIEPYRCHTLQFVPFLQQFPSIATQEPTAPPFESCGTRWPLIRLLEPLACDPHLDLVARLPV